MWRGAKETTTFYRFWSFLARVARDCKGDIYSRFLYLAGHISLSLLIINSSSTTPNNPYIRCLFCVLLLLYNYT
jgi:hypothetical protein